MTAMSISGNEIYERGPETFRLAGSPRTPYHTGRLRLIANAPSWSPTSSPPRGPRSKALEASQQTNFEPHRLTFKQHRRGIGKGKGFGGRTL